MEHAKNTPHQPQPIEPETKRSWKLPPCPTPNLTNQEFIDTVFTNVSDGTYVAVCSKSGDPTEGGWHAERAQELEVTQMGLRNNYVNCSSFHNSRDGTFKARKVESESCHFVLLDDIGTKVSIDKLPDFNMSWIIETSPGNFQAGIILDEPISNGSAATKLVKEIIDAGLSDPGAGGPTSRWARLPNGINGKPKYVDVHGAPFRVRLVSWSPDSRYSPEQIRKGLSLNRSEARNVENAVARQTNSNPNKPDFINKVFTPKPTVNPVIEALQSRGMYKSDLEDGRHDITCPWVNEHTDAKDDGAAYFEPNEGFPRGGFRCHHSHGNKHHIGQLLDHLGVTDDAAELKPIIVLIPGELSAIVDAAEFLLAEDSTYFQSGGLITKVAKDLGTGGISTIPSNAQTLTLRLASKALWKKLNQQKDDFVRIDPPGRPISILHDLQEYKFLLPLAGLARQPFLRNDATFVMKPGYDDSSQIFAEFDRDKYEWPLATPDAARTALVELQSLLGEFHFAAEHDKSAAVCAMLTAAMRPSLDLAPGFHVTAAMYGSGKTYLCDVIASFASPTGSAKVSYPTSSDEATKSILSLLLAGTAVIEFDDMATDWIPHGIIKRMLTAETITDRVLGVSKVATVSTRTLFLGSGNNVGPVRDLLRRVVTITLDPRTSTPATLSYSGDPVKAVKERREHYVGSALTIVRAWQEAGSPRADVASIATYSGSWSDFCRHTLIWLGLPDPATSLLEQIRHDPDAEALQALMTEWYRIFGSTLITVRKLLDKCEYQNRDLYDALTALPVTDQNRINPSKLGWFLKKNANRIVADFEIRKGSADGRVAWQVVDINTPVNSASNSEPPPG